MTAAALELLGEEGVRMLTQPRVAEKAGVRQSHVTYYFPHRSDLVAAVAHRYIETASRDLVSIFQTENTPDLRQLLTEFAYQQVADRRRARTLMGLLVASEEDAVLREHMIEAVTALRNVIGVAIGVAPGDPRATILQATFWGLAINNLLMGDAGGDVELRNLIDRVARETPLANQKKPTSKRRKAK